jgi:DNA-binding transcriptional ArsR family regulator
MEDDSPRQTRNRGTGSDGAETTPRSPPDDRLCSVLELDDVFAALSNPRRRYLVYTLLEESDEKTLAELAARIAAWEDDVSPGEVSEEGQKRVQVSLYHGHVPKLADLGVLSYDAADEIIVRAENTEQVEAVLHGAGTELDARQETHAREDKQR